MATAERLFAERGYAGTSMRQIAADAGVSLETVTQAGRKADLLLAAFRIRFTGAPDAINLNGLVDVAMPADAADLSGMVATMLEGLANGIRGSLGIWRAFTVAATADSTVAAVLGELAVARRREVADQIEAIETAGLIPAREPGERERLADAVGLLVSHDAYEHLTTICGWSHEEYLAWAVPTVSAQLTGSGVSGAT